MSRTDESGRDGLRAAVERLREVIDDAETGWQIPRDVTRALNAATDRIETHIPTPAEESAEVAVEEREARTVVISPVEWADLLADAWEKGASFVASSPTGLDRKTWENPYRSAP